MLFDPLQIYFQTLSITKILGRHIYLLSAMAEDKQGGSVGPIESNRDRL